MTSLGNIVYLVKCLSKPYLKHFFDCKMFIAATSFNPPGTIFKQGSDKWQKIIWIQYWLQPKRNYFQIAFSILIFIISFYLKCIFTIINHVVCPDFHHSISQKGSKGYQESWLGYCNVNLVKTGLNFQRDGYFYISKMVCKLVI